MIDRQLRRPAREAQRMRPAAFSAPRTDARAWDPRRTSADERAEAAQELVGVMFSTAKELRHVAERHFGELFVPTETVEGGRLRTVVSLRTERAGTLHVHAERERHWYPFRVVRVDTPRPEPRANGRETPRPRLPYNLRTASRPRIDWL